MCCSLSLLPWPYTSLALERKRKQWFSGPMILRRELRMCLHSQLIHVLSIIRSQEKEWHMSENTARLHTGIRTSTPHIILLTYEEMTERKQHLDHWGINESDIAVSLTKEMARLGSKPGKHFLVKEEGVKCLRWRPPWSYTKNSTWEQAMSEPAQYQCLSGGAVLDLSFLKLSAAPLLNLTALLSSNSPIPALFHCRHTV